MTDLEGLQMTGKKTAAGFIVAALAGVTLVSTTAAEPRDVLRPDAVQLETRAEALERGAAELQKLNSLGIKTLTQLAQARVATVSRVVGKARAEILIAQSKHAARATGIVSLNWIIDPSYIVDPMVIATPGK